MNSRRKEVAIVISTLLALGCLLLGALLWAFELIFR